MYVPPQQLTLSPHVEEQLQGCFWCCVVLLGDVHTAQ